MSDLKNRTTTLERVLDAPIELVWAAWTKPEHIANWWAPKGMTLDIQKHEFKVGGEWKYSMIMPNGGEFIAEGAYTLIEKLSKIFSSANFRPMTEGVEIQSIFKKDGDKTLFTFHIVHDTEAYRIAQEKMGAMNGWGSVFEGLNEYLKIINS